jgi:hypothetical protein
MRTGKGNQEDEEYEEEEFSSKKDGTSSTANNKGLSRIQTNPFCVFRLTIVCVVLDPILGDPFSFVDYAIN